ncbi:MAG: hypothetical protein Q8R81_04525 [Novosphingobium sp.]|uniref:hypothetical protein n=1 Tax=Novosphingobium sp. TaxID=1874826 RepID=UPI002733631E|nr:hypothetical protein [Novosphingobium sp.]MDP3549642.1 hypothetical protein [Novosphingobium sp.]
MASFTFLDGAMRKSAAATALEMECHMSRSDEIISAEHALAVLETILSALDRMGFCEPALHVSLAIEALKTHSTS